MKESFLCVCARACAIILMESWSIIYIFPWSKMSHFAIYSFLTRTCTANLTFYKAVDICHFYQLLLRTNFCVIKCAKIYK